MVKPHTAQNQVRFLVCLVACLTFVSFAQTARANLYEWTNGAGTVSVKAELLISGGYLTVQLWNTSPVTTADPANALTSIYFDLAGTPALNYLEASGTVISTGLNPDPGPMWFRTGIDGAKNYKGHDDGWKFITAASFDYGIGTAGYSSGPLPAGDQFGSGTDGLSYAIVKGDPTTPNLRDEFLVQDTAFFKFGGLGSLTNDALPERVAFGFGTLPDAIVHTPLPGAVLLGCMGLGVAGWRLRRFA